MKKCKGTTDHGKGCKREVGIDEEYCFQHNKSKLKLKSKKPTLKKTIKKQHSPMIAKQISESEMIRIVNEMKQQHILEKLEFGRKYKKEIESMTSEPKEIKKKLVSVKHPVVTKLPEEKNHRIPKREKQENSENNLTTSESLAYLAAVGLDMWLDYQRYGDGWVWMR
jgi:hypothetical protein